MSKRSLSLYTLPVEIVDECIECLHRARAEPPGIPGVCRKGRCHYISYLLRSSMSVLNASTEHVLNLQGFRGYICRKGRCHYIPYLLRSSMSVLNASTEHVLNLQGFRGYVEKVAVIIYPTC